MNTEIHKSRFSLSVMMSLLLHLIALFLLHLNLQAPNNKPLPASTPLHVRLAPAPPAKPRPLPAGKIITSPAPSPLTASASPDLPPTTAPVNAPPTQGEQITGIAMPGAITMPFSGYRAEGNAFFQQRNAQQTAMIMYQEQVKAMQAKQLAEQRTRLLVAHLKEILEKFINSDEKIPEGKCYLDEKARHFICIPENLTQAAASIEPVTIEIFRQLQNSERKYNGFIFNKHSAPYTAILIQEHTPVIHK